MIQHFSEPVRWGDSLAKRIAITGGTGVIGTWLAHELRARGDEVFVITRGKELEEGEGGSLILGPAGNSFSGPHAAGVAALMLSVNPELNPWEISEILGETATDLGSTGPDFTFGAGLINALAAVREAKNRN